MPQNDGSRIGNLSPEEAGILRQVEPVEIVEFLQALIQQRSDFPPGDCRGAIRLTREKLKEAGIKVRQYALLEHQPSIVASFGNEKSTSCLMYHSHIDTVAPGDMNRWSVGPFEGKVVEGKIYGRGAGDDKSSVAAQVLAMVALARAGVKLNGCLKVAVAADEESGASYGTQWLHKEGKLKAAALVVGEQTGNQVAIAERVACGIDLTVYGKSAHGAMPWAGENAVLKTARALAYLQEKLVPQFAVRRHPYLPPATLNIGKIQGGMQWNIVPDFCKVEMDRRLLPGETREIAMNQIREALDDFSRRVEPLSYELFSTGEVAPNIDTPPDDPLVILANQTLTDISGEGRALTGYMQTSDGRWFVNDRIPIIIFGPSDPAVAHSVDEYVTISQLVEATHFYALLAMRYFRQT